jgi:hypothetical protein
MITHDQALVAIGNLSGIDYDSWKVVVDYIWQQVGNDNKNKAALLRPTLTKEQYEGMKTRYQEKDG